MQKEKKRKVFLIVAIVLLVVLIVIIATAALSCSAKKRQESMKRNIWYDTTMYNATIVVTIEDTQEGTKEISLKDIKEYRGHEDDVAIVEIHGNAQRGCYPEIGIINDGVVVREIDYPSELKEKDLVRGYMGESAYKEGYLDYATYICQLYKRSDDDSLEVYKIIEIRLYHTK